VYSGVEVRVPVLLNKSGAPMLQLAPFFDFGAGWNVDSTTPPPTTISSAGIGVLFALEKHLRAQFYWGNAFRDSILPPAPAGLGDSLPSECRCVLARIKRRSAAVAHRRCTSRLHVLHGGVVESDLHEIDGADFVQFSVLGFGVTSSERASSESYHTPSSA